MIEYKPLIITDDQQVIEGNNYCVFIDTSFSVNLFLQLLKIESKFIFINNYQLYSEIEIETERTQIVDYLNNGLELELEHYTLYDLTNPELDLNMHVTDDSQSIDGLFKVIDNKYIIENISRFHVTEYYIAETVYLAKLCQLVFTNIDVNQIAITSNKADYFKVVTELSDGEQLIAKTSLNNSYQILCIPDDFRFKVTPNLILLNDYDYKYAIQNLFNNQYIIGFKDSLKDSHYFRTLCTDYNIKTVDNNLQAIIAIVEKYQHIVITEIEEDKQILRYTLTNQDDGYKRLILVYKHCIKNNLSLDINFSQVLDK